MLPTYAVILSASAEDEHPTVVPFYDKAEAAAFFFSRSKDLKPGLEHLVRLVKLAEVDDPYKAEKPYVPFALY